MKLIDLPLWLAMASLPLSGLAETLSPQLDENGRSGYAEFRQSAPHRAFAIAPGGTWSWRGGMETPELAAQAASSDCEGHARRRCLIYTLDDQVVFKPRDWAQAWRPYPSAAQVARAPAGVKPGQRFPDLVWHDGGGRTHKVSEQRGNVVLLHFWGSWCPPCQREMPDLSKLYQRTKAAPNLRFVFLPVRETAATSRAWLRGRGLDLPVADAGARAAKEGAFTLADGNTLRDRDLARAFPTTYILDRNGGVLFAHVGPVTDWPALEPLLLDAARAQD